MVVRSVMDAFDFTQLQRIDHQADITVSGKPPAVMLVGHFVSITDAVLFHPPMSADVKNRRSFPFEVFGNVQVSGNVQSGTGLKMQILDGELRMLDLPGNHRFQIRFLRQRIKSQHLEELFAVAFAARVPVIESFDFGESSGRQLRGLSTEVLGNHFIAVAGIG